jgi:hypothetical protein
LEPAIEGHVQALKALRAQKREDEIEKDAEGDYPAQDVINHHEYSPSVAGRQIKRGRDKGHESDDNEQKIEHGRVSTFGAPI